MSHKGSDVKLCRLIYLNDLLYTTFLLLNHVNQLLVKKNMLRLRSRISAGEINSKKEDLNEISVSVSAQPVLVGDDTAAKEEAANVKDDGNLSSSNEFTWEPLPRGRLAGANTENLHSSRF